MDNLQFTDALDNVWKIITRTNKYIDETTPWVLAKNEDDKDKLADVMYHLVDALRIVAILIQPVLIETPKQIFEQLGLDFEAENSALDQAEIGLYPKGTQVVSKGVPIFPRLDTEEEVAYIQSQMTVNSANEEVADDWDPEDTEWLDADLKAIKYDDFDKVELRVAEVKDADTVEGADKLLKFRLDAGDNQDRQILSGIRQWYPDPSALIGKKVIIVGNLKPRKMRGEISQGMILSIEDGDDVRVVIVPDNLPNGSRLG